MAKFRFTCSIGIGRRDEVVEIPDEELEGMEGKERDDYIEESYSDWRSNFLDGGWEELD